MISSLKSVIRKCTYQEIELHVSANRAGRKLAFKGLCCLLSCISEHPLCWEQINHTWMLWEAEGNICRIKSLSYQISVWTACALSRRWSVRDGHVGSQTKSFPYVPVSGEGNEFHATHTRMYAHISSVMPIHSKCRARGREREGGMERPCTEWMMSITQCLRGGVLANSCVCVSVWWWGGTCLAACFVCACFFFFFFAFTGGTRHIVMLLQPCPCHRLVCVCACGDVCLWNPVCAIETAWVQPVRKQVLVCWEFTGIKWMCVTFIFIGRI